MSQTLARRNGGVALLGAGPRRVVFFVAIAAWALCGRDYARGCYDAPAPRASGLHPCVNLGIVLPSARDRLGKLARAYCVENLAGTLPYLGQLNQFAGAGKLAMPVPLRPRALRITVRGPDHFSGGRAASGKQRNFRSSQRQLQKQKTRRWAGLVVVMQVQAANAFAAMP